MDDKIRAYYDKRKSCYKDKELEGMLVERCRYLNRIFEVTQEQLDKLCKINAKLQESTEQVLDKLLCEDSRLRLVFHKDGFTEDYELEGVVAIDVDEYSDAGPTDILEIIDSVQPNINLIDHMFYCNGGNPDRDCRLIDRYSADVFAGVTLRIGAEGVDFHCCWAMHRLIDHSLFALEDIVRISDGDNYTWNEVVLRYQNFGEYLG